MPWYNHHMGMATIDFGGPPGTSQASVTVSGQTELTAAHLIQVHPVCDATSDHTPDEIRSEEIYLTAEYSGALSFIIHAAPKQGIMQGTFSVKWFYYWL